MASHTQYVLVMTQYFKVLGKTVCHSFT